MNIAPENLCSKLAAFVRRRVPSNLLEFLLFVALLPAIAGCGAPEQVPAPVYEVVNRPQPVGGFIDVNIVHRNKDVLACNVYLVGRVNSAMCTFNDGLCSVRLPNVNAGKIVINVSCTLQDVLASWENGLCGEANRNGSPDCEFNAIADSVYNTGFTSCNGKGSHGVCGGKHFPTHGTARGIIVSVPKVAVIGGVIPRGDTWVADATYGSYIMRKADDGAEKLYTLPKKNTGEEIWIHAGIAQSDTDHKVYFAGERKYPGVSIRGRWYLAAYDPAKDQIEEVEVPAISSDNILDTTFDPDHRFTFPPLGIGTIAVSRDGESIVLGVPLAALAGGNQIVYLYQQGTGYKRGEVRGLPLCSLPPTPGGLMRSDRCPLAESLDGFVDPTGIFYAGVFQEGFVYLGHKSGTILDFVSLVYVPKKTSLCEPTVDGQGAFVKVIGSRIARPGNRIRLACTLGPLPGVSGSKMQSTIWVYYPGAARQTITMPGKMINGAVSSSTHNTLISVMDYYDPAFRTSIFILPWENDPAKLASKDWTEVAKDEGTLYARGEPPGLSAAGVDGMTPANKSDEYDTLSFCPRDSTRPCYQGQIPPKY